MLEKIRHYNPETYRRLMELDSDFGEQGALYAYVRDTFGLTDVQFEQVVANTHQAADILRIDLQGRQAPLRPRPGDVFLTGEVKAQQVDCGAPLSNRAVPPTPVSAQPLHAHTCEAHPGDGLSADAGVAARRRSAADSLRIAVISDLNGSYGSDRYGATVDEAGAAHPRTEAGPRHQHRRHGGRATQAAPLAGRGGRDVAAFHAHVSDPLAAAGIPLAVTPGNHDGSAYHGFELERRIYAEQWQPRKPALEFVDDSHYPFYFAFAFGDLLFVSLDATTVGHLPREQMDWLRELLAIRLRVQAKGRVQPRAAVAFREGAGAEYIGDPALEQLLKHAATWTST